MSPARYRHYGNGCVYEVAFLSKQERDWDDLVTYFDIDDPKRQLATRPATEFFGLVHVPIMPGLERGQGFDRHLAGKSWPIAVDENGMTRRYAPLTGRE